MSRQLKILFLGDIVGRPGRSGVKKYLEKHRRYYDFVIANIENASHGYGLTKKNYNELCGYGIHAMTGGNHIWDRKEIFEYINEADRLIRPLNYPEGTPGVGSRIFQVDEHVSIGVISILGVVFMEPLCPPWQLLNKEIDKIKSKTNVIIIDCHAEATAEKLSCGYIAADKAVSAVLGTHTHVQTADEMIINETTAYITDTGFCGSHKSIIGMEIKGSVERLVTQLPLRFEIAPAQPVQINGVELSIDSESGRASAIKRINCLLDLTEEVNE